MCNTTSFVWIAHYSRASSRQGLPAQDLLHMEASANAIMMIKKSSTLCRSKRASPAWLFAPFIQTWQASLIISSLPQLQMFKHCGSS